MSKEMMLRALREQTGTDPESRVPENAILAYWLATGDEEVVEAWRVATEEWWNK